jgi:hypothetical protein
MIELILIFILGLVIGWRVAEFINQQVLHGILDDLGITEQQLREVAKRKGIDLPEAHSSHTEDDLTDVGVMIEEHNGVLYAYREDTQEFLGQGHDRDSLITHISTRLNNVKLIITSANGSDLLQKNNT